MCPVALESGLVHRRRARCSRAARVSIVAFVLPLGITGIVACTKATPAPVATSTIVSTVTVTPTIGPTAPVNAGPTTTTTIASCPLISTDNLHLDVGQRLAKVTEQYAGGRLVGCTWYPLTHPTSQCPETCFLREDLPPGSQADVKISSSTYASTDAARAAFIRLAERGTGVERDQVASNNTGLCFKTNFWAHDDGSDVACTFAVGTRVVLINTVVIDASTDVVLVAQAVVSHF
jgi:hypothetical protein